MDDICITLLENIHPKAVEVFRGAGFKNVHCLSSALQGKKLIDQIKDSQLVGIRSGTHFNKEILEACPKLLALGCFCIGTNQVDHTFAMEKGIPVFNDPHSNTRSVAELVIGLCIALMRGIFRKNALSHAGKWTKITQGSHEIRGKTLGIIGYGRIGSQVSILAESMGMRPIYFDTDQKLKLGNAQEVGSLEELLASSDIVTLHVPETKETKGLIDHKKLSLMKKSAFLINTSRGKVVDLQALAKALKTGDLKGAAIDVFPEEPKEATESFQTELHGLENVILTPHIAGATEEAQENIGQMVSQKLIHFIKRGSTEGAVNFPELALPPLENTHRILHVHKNIPGMLSKVNKVLADGKINILAQFLKTLPEVGYLVFDIENTKREGLIDALRRIPGTIRARILY